ncbi:MAG: HNH endonuclease [Crocosphaera sp.]
MTKCYVCEKEITEENQYNEHIIVNAIGGKLKSKNLICSNYSPDFDSIDTELAKQLNLITCHLDVKRERGNKKIPKTTATIVATGEEIFIEPGGKPVFKNPKPPKKKKKAIIFR